MKPIFITVGSALPLMILPDTEAHLDGHPVITYTYSLYRNKDEFKIPADKYQVYYLGGQFPANIGEAWQQIWASDTDRKYTADYDFYRADPKSFEETEARIYLAVR